MGERGRLWLAIGIVVAVVVLVASVSVVVRGLPGPAHRDASAGTSAPGAVPGGPPAASTGDGTGGPTGDPAGGATGDPTGGAAPVVPPVPELVRLDGPAAGHPEAPAVAELLTRHFTAIDDRDYASWTTTVSGHRSANQPEARWRYDFRSTDDSGVVVGDITTTSSGLAVALRFTSTQDVDAAPPDLPVGRICWTSTWPLVDEGSGWRIDTPPRGSTSKSAC